MNTQSVDEALEAAENALRDFIREVLEKEYGDKWLENCGIEEKRIEQWKQFRDKEKKKDISGITEDRLLYYSDFSDLRSIINRHWRLFKPCFKDKNRILSRLQELKAFRDTDAHRRDLLTHQKQIVLGYCGEIRTAITEYRSKQTPEGEYFPRIEYVKDSFGNIVYSDPTGIGNVKDTKRTLFPGDEVEFVVVAWDPAAEPLQYSFEVQGRDPDLDFGVTSESKPVPQKWVKTNRAILKILPEDIAADFFVEIKVKSSRQYHARTGFDDNVFFIYKVLPKESPKKKS